MSRRRVYMDACCFVELALDAKGSAVFDDGRFVWPLQSLLRAARDGKIDVFTSMISITECIHVGGDTSEDVQRLFRGMLTSGTSGVIPWQQDIFVSERARDLRWVHDINLKSNDAIHVASALEAKCDEFITWDGIGNKPKSIMKAAPKIAQLGLEVLTPDNTKSIPEEYRQHTLDGLGETDGADKEAT